MRLADKLDWKGLIIVISVLKIMGQINIKYVVVNVNYDKMWPEKELGFCWTR
jgi:hypothetical protein